MGLQGGCAGLRPKRGAENLAVLRFSGPAMLGRSPAQASDEVFVEVPHQELGFRSHAINDSIFTYREALLNNGRTSEGLRSAMPSALRSPW